MPKDKNIYLFNITIEILKKKKSFEVTVAQFCFALNFSIITLKQFCTRV